MSIALAGCSNGIGAIQTGALGGGDDDQGGPDANGNDPDAGVVGDAPHGTSDATLSGVACTATTTDVGVASTYLLNKPIYNATGKFFVVRDANGLYAVTAKCTHEGAVMNVSGSDYRCSRHGALFTYDGTIVSGPVSQPLVHYSMCNLANGNLGVETSLVVAKSQRLVA